MTMYIDNILKDISDLIYLNNVNWNNTFKNKKDAERHEDLADALYGLDQAMDALQTVEDRLRNLMEDIQMEALSHKVQSKGKTLADLFDEEEASKL